MQITKSCRSCGSTKLHEVVNLGATPLADRLLTFDQLSEPEPKYPLTLVFCEECSLLQITETIPPEVLYCQDYPYYSSVSDQLQQHSQKNALEIIESRSLNECSQVIELASNDGYLLRHYQQHNVSVLGIDPAGGPAQKAIDSGIETITRFFGLELARSLVADGIKADIIHANNVLAHVPELNEFVSGIHYLLKEDGLAVVEVPTVKPLVEQCAFDTIYHEHLCYFSIKALDVLFKRHGLYIAEIRSLPIHGGSVRLYLSKRKSNCDGLAKMISEEQEAGLHCVSGYSQFSNRIWELKEQLLNMLKSMHRDGKRIAAYGAAAKGSTLANTVGLGPELIDYVVDMNPFKHGRFMPGVHLPICSTSELGTRMPDYLLLFAWNFCDEIRSQRQAYEQAGGRFIVPIPTPTILSSHFDV